jgi:hypothetical protein
MPPDRATPGSAQDWLARARSDLAIAQSPLPDRAFLEDLCFQLRRKSSLALARFLNTRPTTGEHRRLFAALREQYPERFLAESGCRWLAKPFRLAELLRVTREVIG